MYKVGLIGCGNIFPMHAASVGLTPEAELAAVCDVKEERASQAGGRYQVPFYTDYKQMIEKEKLDAVHILTPTISTPKWLYMPQAKGYMC
ncbi:Gfo/Idh/MocA family oxidoreductase [Paenibacillus larvae]|nr:Gfo/Idh/MocA family oxidoreductase [Paenibacillus larvae]MDT2237210.1 Gfo/Idh/MocA family oxidoreductase [Paenibacillus larvae]MDT2247444.1 Gfo/Idh/MocA family oxidoreductase [Paenibacillus larvae]MDT2261190.1 Gfo/Idh/MocA family oxidoreductase [Paenibacillus larvae]MDT2264501.1 Gfo/Idh/MocA family oxidoreductase [Paenibacillus larvae]MDT2276296.1 Gfo/Idh/MocA family oxidoreductase [Paenibacillus larvae]